MPQQSLLPEEIEIPEMAACPYGVEAACPCNLFGCLSFAMPDDPASWQSVKCEINRSCLSPISWLGGKAKLANKLIPLFPEHVCYCEVFAGAAWCLFKKTPSTVEVINDINGELVNFFRVLQTDFGLAYFEHRLRMALYSREEFYRLRDLDSAHMDEYFRAWRFFYINRCSFGSRGLCAREGSFGVSAKGCATAKTFGNASREVKAGDFARASFGAEKSDSCAASIFGRMSAGDGRAGSFGTGRTRDVRYQSNKIKPFESGFRNATFGHFKRGCEGQPKVYPQLHRPPHRLEIAHDRLQGVVIERFGWRDCLKLYDAPQTFFYVDPPYYGHERDYGKGIFERSDFEKLAEALAGLKGKFLLSINDTPEIREIFGGLKIKEEFLAVYSANNRKAVHKPELVYANY